MAKRSSRRYVKVTAKVVGVMSAVPQLDALLIDVMAHRFESVPHSRSDPAPRFDQIPPIPIAWDKIGGHRVYRCSSPIFRVEQLDEEYCVQAFPKELSDLLDNDKLGVLRVGSGDQKSLRLKRNAITASEIVWFAALNNQPSTLRKEVKKVIHLGSDRKRGRGRVIEWTVEDWLFDWSWFAEHKSGQVLMRNLPDCDELPGDLQGYLREYNSVTPPYWHPQRLTDAVVPC